jgi:hypothetical protein
VDPRALAAGVEVGLARGAGDLEGILRLQRVNLEASLDPDEVARDGFVTAVHTLEILERMHALAPSIVARADGEVVGYALAMPLECRPLVPLLEPMFRQFEVTEFRGAPLLSHRVYVMGQVCVARSHRGSGLFDSLYAAHKVHYADRFDLLVTEVAVRNGRSLRAHLRVGFLTVAHYTLGSEEWAVVALPLAEGS